MLDQALQNVDPRVRMSDIDELRVLSTSDEESETKEANSICIGGDDRVPPAPPDMKREVTDEQIDFEKKFDVVLSSMKQTEVLRFSAIVSNPDQEGGLWRFRIRLISGKKKYPSCVWEAMKSISELRRLAEKLQKDLRIRGMGCSIPALPERRSLRVSEVASKSDREAVIVFVRTMFTNFVFLGQYVVLDTFKVPSAVRTKIDTLVKIHQTALLSTFLNKQGWQLQNWKKRWAVLYPDFTLRYYESRNKKTDRGIGFRGMIDVQAMHTIRFYKHGDNYRLTLSLKSDWEQDIRPRVFKLETDSKDICEIWCNAISKLRDGELCNYIPQFSVSNEITVEELCGLSGGSRNHWQGSNTRGQVRKVSQLQLVKEKETNIRLLAKLSEMRQLQETFEENEKKERDVYEREQSKIEDEWSDLNRKMVAAKKKLKREQLSVIDLDREINEKSRKWEEQLESNRNNVERERSRFNLKSANFRRKIEKPSVLMKRSPTMIENSAPLAYAGRLWMLTGESVKRKRDVWYLMISDVPFMEWAEVREDLDARSATRMRIAEVLSGSKEHKGRSFIVRSYKKDKEVTFITSNCSECKKWISTIKNGLGILTDSEYDFDELDEKVETVEGKEDYQETYSRMLNEEKDEVTLTEVSKEATAILMSLKHNGIVGETEV